MREIEVKASVVSTQAVVDLLMKRGIAVTDPVTQHDRVYGQSGVDGGADNNAPWLRIRSETKHDRTVHIFTLKKSVTNQMDSIEHETEVSDEAELELIIKHLSFVPYSDLTKTRQKAQIGDIEECIDIVDGLGSFVEAEKLTDEVVDYDVVCEELWDAMEQLGISRDDEVTDGYDVLMNRKLGVV